MSEVNEIDREDLEAAADKYDELMKPLYLEVQGYIHPLEGGDDYHFIRGFKIKAERKEAFEIWFKKDYEKTSYPVDDYNIKEVTKTDWELNFTI